MGTVGPSGQVIPDDPVKRLDALESLRPRGRPFVVRLYAGYGGPGGPSVEAQVGPELREYAAAGFELELALTYRPADAGSPQDVTGFAEFARQTVREFGPLRGFVSLQVTNEANLSGAPNASDGYYAGAKDALIQGVIAAHDERQRDHLGQLHVGFNWAYSADAAEPGFWRYLWQHGGSRFVSAIDWVGLDVYPGTWGPSIGGGGLAAATSHAIVAALRELRRRFMPLARIGPGVRLHIAENGYPTGPDRTPAMQATALHAAVTTIHTVRNAFNISDYCWFDLRDADTSSSSFESQYGLMTDAYSPKPAFAEYRRLVARFSGRQR